MKATMLKGAQAAILIIAGVFIGAALSSFAGPVLEVGAGLSKYHAREDGIWQQSNSQLQTHNYFDTKGYQIGARWDLARHIAARLAYVNLGHFYADNEFVMDDSVDHYPLQCPKDPGDCKMRGKISGNAYGLSLGPVLRGTWKGIIGEIEGGGFIFRSNQKTAVCQQEAGGLAEGCWSYNRMWGVHRTWYVGGAVGYGPVSLSYRLYWNVFEQGTHMPGGDAGITGGKTQTVFLTYAF